jgi:hypothetical protein
MLLGSHTLQNWKTELMREKLERILKEVIMANWGTIMTFGGKGWEEPWNNSIRITNDLADIWSGHFASTT